MKKIILLIFLFTYPLQSQTTLIINPSNSQIEYFSFNLDKLTDENGVSILGNDSFPAGSIILNDMSTGENFGCSVSTAGDVNNDGFDDVIIGAKFYNSNQGRAYIFYGGLFMDNQADVTMSGESEGDQFGYSVSTAGDVNNDGYSDVIVGAIYYGNNSEGRAYIYYGSTIMDSTVDKILLTRSFFFGYSVSTAGDVNGDGFDDLIVGGGLSDIGPCNFIYFGGSEPDSIADLIIVRGNFFSSSSSSAGDVNGDGFDDVIIEYFGNTASIFYGGTNMDQLSDLTFTSYNGIPVSDAGDVNGDGYDDVIIGAHFNLNSKGNAFILFGGMDMDSIPDVILTGENEGDKFGWSVSSAGDLNGDGFDDVVAGANGFDSGKGKAYVFFGGINMDNIPDATMCGETINDNFGFSVSSAGDVNGDGSSDIVIGANNYNNGTGKSYIYAHFKVHNLIYPANHSADIFTSINFRWNRNISADYYFLKISEDSMFNGHVICDSILIDTTKIVSGLKRNTKYYWKVEAKSNSGFTINSTVYGFTTIPPVYLNLKLLMEGLYSPTLNTLQRRDSVKVYLINASSPFSLTDSSQNVIDSNIFTGNFTFQNATNGIYYISVKHFNSIETWSRPGGEYLFTDGYVYSYDFTNSPSKAYGNNLKLKGSRYCMFSGDVNQDGYINLSDVIPINNDASDFLSGVYIVTDLTGDGIVDLTDVSLCFNNASKFIQTLKP